jgi:hypothetical protein
VKDAAVPLPIGELQTPGRAAFDAVELIRWRRQHGRWPTVEEAVAMKGRSIVIGASTLPGSIVMPTDPTGAWAEWQDAQAEQRHADAEAAARHRHQEMLGRIEASHRRSEEQRDEFIAELRQLADELGLTEALDRRRAAGA